MRSAIDLGDLRERKGVWFVLVSVSHGFHSNIDIHVYTVSWH